MSYDFYKIVQKNNKKPLTKFKLSGIMVTLKVIKRVPQVSQHV